MFHTWKFIFLLAMSLFLLGACGQPLEKKEITGVKAAESAFYSNARDSTEKVDGINLYKPFGFVVNESSDSENILFENKKSTFILSIDPNEEENSRLFYDLLLTDPTKQVKVMDTFSENGTFGFAAIVESDGGRGELIVSVGGAKMTTLSNERKVVPQLTRMMEIVRSIK